MKAVVLEDDGAGRRRHEAGKKRYERDDGRGRGEREEGAPHDPYAQ
jgi:hypothetical protein